MKTRNIVIGGAVVAVGVFAYIIYSYGQIFPMEGTKDLDENTEPEPQPEPQPDPKIQELVNEVIKDCGDQFTHNGFLYEYVNSEFKKTKIEKNASGEEIVDLDFSNASAGNFSVNLDEYLKACRLKKIKL